ncbi:TrkA C-terminal domain-containing protein [Erysipelothrix sp. D19-032]
MTRQRLKHKLASLMDKRHELDTEINNVIQEIMDISSRFASSDPLRRFEYNIDPSSKLVGKSIRSSSFYQITNMTIIAINRRGAMMLSPDQMQFLKHKMFLWLLDIFKM